MKPSSNVNRSAKVNRSSADRVVLNQARRGNPKAIETLAQQDLSRLIEGRGVRVRVRVERRNATLLVHLTAPTAPQRGTSMAWAKLFFAKLPVVGVNGAQILSHRAEFRSPFGAIASPSRPSPRAFG
ncbi:MAG: hypothetical protein HC771_01095 [Synechococcales cyanobacterium CRU_2_2]|nr:hypothetical protein [Synechococcales cyanobacterium CRU_2_2]